jgi:hypothetical protein
MIQDELQQLSTKTRDLRKFGFVVGGVFLLLGGWFLVRHKPAGPYFLTPGVLLVLLGFVAPRALKVIYIAWMSLSFTLGLLVSTVVLTLFYFLIITPLGLTGRLVGKDFLSEKLDPNAKSYWLWRDRSRVRSPIDYEQQY